MEFSYQRITSHTIIHPVRWMVSGWLMLICCERKTPLNDWLISADKHK
jgi:hypothetical protein